MLPTTVVSTDSATMNTKATVKRNVRRLESSSFLVIVHIIAISSYRALSVYLLREERSTGDPLVTEFVWIHLKFPHWAEVVSLSNVANLSNFPSVREASKCSLNEQMRPSSAHRGTEGCGTSLLSPNPYFADFARTMGDLGIRIILSCPYTPSSIAC